MEPPISSLIDWAVTNGATVDPLLSFKASADRGIYATYNKTLTTPATSPQLEIPTELILTNLLSNAYFDKTFKTGNPNSSLKLFLSKLKYDNEGWVQAEDGDVDYQNFFKPYVDLLPVGRQTGSCFYWNKEELKLLENTNLGGSIRVKLESLLKEWKDSILQLPEKFQYNEQLKKDLDFFDQFQSITHDELLNYLLNNNSWTSFGTYLWSSIIFTSRAFPNHIINNKTKDGQAILLPVIDLLNHNNSTKIQWNHTIRGDSEFFSLQNLDLLQEGEEICNNYGAKGNEELLMGYGFVTEDNTNNSIALRIKLPVEVIKSAKDSGITIPKIDDYTFHSFENNNQQDTKSEINEEGLKDGLLYFINESSLIPENLLSLFQFLVLNPNETKPTLRAKLQALQNLKQALEQKAKALKKTPVVDYDLIDESIRHSALVYRKDQQTLYKSSISEIKSTEKAILSEYKSYVSNMKKLYLKLYNNDRKLQELLETMKIYDSEGIEVEDLVDVTYFIWLIIHAENLADEEYSAPDWIVRQYQELKPTYVHDPSSGNFKGLEEFLQKFFTGADIGAQLTEGNLSLANHVLNNNCYTRLNTCETILVETLEL